MPYRRYRRRYGYSDVELISDLLSTYLNQRAQEREFYAEQEKEPKLYEVTKTLPSGETTVQLVSEKQLLEPYTTKTAPTLADLFQKRAEEATKTGQDIMGRYISSGKYTPESIQEAFTTYGRKEEFEPGPEGGLQARGFYPERLKEIPKEPPAPTTKLIVAEGKDYPTLHEWNPTTQNWEDTGMRTTAPGEKVKTVRQKRLEIWRKRAQQGGIISKYNKPMTLLEYLESNPDKLSKELLKKVKGDYEAEFLDRQEQILKENPSITQDELYNMLVKEGF